ncbi:MAG TPA: 3-methyl-2-oxobutanoate hydroxymethyltransferase [Candidatus Binataceae bacterium]|jgi:3-methyl-2-oxobutanoate hydroxymethyltransferase|nr:3-methyl-2-oxobutanoate hydroxymethyltransferase [Candidatus Binataceae bacterium]
MNKDKVRVTDLARMKAEGRPITMLTAYDFPFARIFDRAGVDVLLVGDSLGMAVQGADSTLGVTVEDILYHTRIVARARQRALLVADMPFLSYQVSVEQAMVNAGRMLKEGGAEAVKLEGGTVVADTVRRLVDYDIPVMGHIGLTPQSVHRMGGHRVQGRRAGRGPGCRERLIEDAAALEEAGAFAIVLEGIPVELTEELTARVKVPTIGIGAGPACAGQVLVMHDMLGLSEGFMPRFAKPYAQLWNDAACAAAAYVREVRERTFPAPEHCYHLRGA